MKPEKEKLKVLILFLFPVFLTILAFTMLMIPLPKPFPEPGSHERNLPAAIITGILGMTWVIVVVLYSISAIFRSGRWLEDLMIGLGLAAGNYHLIGRQYQGQMDSHQVDIQFLPARKPFNHLLNIRVQTSNQRRMAIGVQIPLLDCQDCPQVDITKTKLDKQKVFAQNPSWAAGFLCQAATVTLLQNLLADQYNLGSRQLYFQPGSLWLHSRPTDYVNKDHVIQWKDQLLELVKILELQH